MAEPVPSKTQKADENPDSATNPDDTAPEATLPRNAEDRAAAAALSSLDADVTATGAGDAGAVGGAKGGKGAPSAADREALGKAMNRLEALTGGKKQSQVQTQQASQTGAAKKMEKKDGKSAAEEGAKAKAPVVKVAVEDVNLLVGCAIFVILWVAC